MRRIDKAMVKAGGSNKIGGYCGPLASTDNDGHIANVNNLSNSQIDGQLMMPYGVSSKPKKGIMAQVVVNGDDSNAVVGVYDSKRPKVKTGEVCLYSSGNAKVYLTKDGDISIKSGSSSISMDKNGNININGTVNITGSLKVNGQTMNVP